MARTWWKRSTLAVILLGLLVGTSGCSSFALFEKKEPVTLKFVFLENTANYQPLADEFQRQHNNITIELLPVKRSQNITRDLAQAAAEADAIRIPAMSLSTEMASALLPLDTLISTNPKFPINDLFPGTLDGLKLDGRQVAIPAGLNPYVFFYLPEKFTAAGLQPPNANWRLEDFVTSATAINNTDESLRGTERLTYGFCSHPSLPDAVMFAYLFGGSLVDSPYHITAPTLNSQANIEALTWYASLKTDFGLMPDISQIRELGRALFSGNCAFWMDWMDRSTFGMRDEREVAMLPFPGYTSPFGAMTLDVYALLSRTTHPDEAFQWATFLMGQQSASGQLIPPLKAQVASPEYAARASAATRAIARSMPEQTIVLGLEMYRDERFGTALQLFQQAAQQVLQGDISAEEALNTAQMQAEQVFK